MDTISHVRSFFEKYPDWDHDAGRKVVLKVNQLMDVAGAGPDGHVHCWRKFLHHREGIEYVRSSLGAIAALAAEQHVLDDCGSIHSVLDYYNGTLDENGVERNPAMTKMCAISGTAVDGPFVGEPLAHSINRGELLEFRRFERRKDEFYPTIVVAHYRHDGTWVQVGTLDENGVEK